jgi:hypothetical protein
MLVSHTIVRALQSWNKGSLLVQTHINHVVEKYR